MVSTRGTSRSTLWRNRDFVKLWAGQTVSLAGSQVTTLALPLTAVLLLRATPVQTGLLYAAQFAPFLVLTLFAVMLTHRISDVNVSNRAVGRLPAAVLVGIAFAWMVHVARRAAWVVKDPGAPAPTTYGIGNAFLRQYALPFEIASLVLLAALIGAIVVSRKEVKA